MSEVDATALVESWSYSSVQWTYPDSAAGETETLHLSFRRAEGEAYTIVGVGSPEHRDSGCWGGTFLRMPVEATLSDLEGVQDFSVTGSLDIASLDHSWDVSLRDLYGEVELYGERLEDSQAHLDIELPDHMHWVAWWVELYSGSTISEHQEIGDLAFALSALVQEEGAVSTGASVLERGQFLP